MVRILLSGEYLQSLKTLIETNPELQQPIDLAIARFRRNPEDARLQVHVLRKSLQSKWSLGVTDDIRIVFEYTAETIVRFLKIGTHPNVYPGYPAKKSS